MSQLRTDLLGMSSLVAGLRVRTVVGKRQEVELPLVQQLQGLDPMDARVVEQILLGVSTRGYEQSRETPGDGHTLLRRPKCFVVYSSGCATMPA